MPPRPARRPGQNPGARTAETKDVELPRMSLNSKPSKMAARRTIPYHVCSSVSIATGCLILMSDKLLIRMVPGPLWGRNLRKSLPKSQWQKLRKQVIAERGLKCQMCGKIETESKRVFAHEDWDYQSTYSPAVAHLKQLLLSCWHCHAVEHFGATGNMVMSGELTQRAIEDTIDHFCRVNGADREAFYAHHKELRRSGCD